MRRDRQLQPSTERGAVLVLTAVTLVVILVIAALVVDMGVARAEQRRAQSTADLAATAAGFYLSGRASPDARIDVLGACRAAINSAQTDLDDFAPKLTSSELGTACSAFPADGSTCTAGTDPISATLERGPYTLTITWPVPASSISDARRSGGSGPNDGTACERLSVTLDRTNATYFAGVVGATETDVRGSAVVRTDRAAPSGLGVAALVLLERLGCGVLQTAGGGSQGSGVVVRNAGPTSPSNPGAIQADSAGVVPPCSTNNNADGYVVYGTALPAAGGGGPSIVAEAAVNGTPGLIGIRALAPTINGRGAAVVGSGVSPAPVPSDITSRQPADDKYNSPANGSSISNLHNTGRALVTGAAPAGYAVISGAMCTGLNTTDLPLLNASLAVATRVYVDCADFQPGNLVLAAAQTVIFTGKVTVANNRFLSLPLASRIYVRGCTSNCSGGGNYSISVAGELRVNTEPVSSLNVLCALRAGLGAGGTFSNTTAIATFGGPVLVTGQARLCQTTLYIARSPSSAYARSTATNGGPAIAACTPTRPCPSDTAGDAVISVTGGAGSIDWSAPNRFDRAPTAADFAVSPFEDLALWAEGSADSFIKGQGASRTEGVFFLPNSTVTFTGQATQSQPLNAQFLARRLIILGQSAFNLQPSAADVVPTPLPGGIYLIR